MNKGNYIRTTVNVRADLYETIESYAEKYCKRNEDVIRVFLEKMIKKLLQKKEFFSNAMMYQAVYPDWEKPHISISKVDYDRFLDIKKAYRLSLSLILAMALEEFSESIMEDEDLDNYPEYSYKKYVYNNINELKYEYCWKKEGKYKKEEKT